MKLGPTFNFSKPYKRLIANIIDPHQRGKIKRLFIIAQVLSSSTANPRHVKEDAV